MTKTSSPNNLGNRLSWVALLAPFVAVGCALAFVLGPIGEVESVDEDAFGEKMITYSGTPWGSFFITSAVLSIVFGVVAAIIAPFHASGRTKWSAVRVMIGVVLLGFIVGRSVLANL
ncbi:MAG: hypothetical protein AAGD22_04560 [Verrucomicrobiota bacterium]